VIRAEAAARAAAALCAAALLWALPGLPGAAPRAQCARPAEGEAEAGATRAVTCSGGPALRGPARLLFGLHLDPNRAAPRELEALPGIGPARAAAIAAERCRRPFASTADLARVRGLGPRTRAALEPWLAVEAPAEARCTVD
jgi:competence protein ComEA